MKTIYQDNLLKETFNSCITNYAPNMQTLLKEHPELLETRLIVTQGEGLTPLLAACRHACMDVMKVLIDAGADISATGDGRGVLHEACFSNAPSAEHALIAIEYLLEKGANSLVVDREGLTAAAYAENHYKRTGWTAWLACAGTLREHEQTLRNLFENDLCELNAGTQTPLQVTSRLTLTPRNTTGLCLK